MNTSFSYNVTPNNVVVNTTVNFNTITASDISKCRSAYDYINSGDDCTMSDFGSKHEAYTELDKFVKSLIQIKISNTVIRPIDQSIFTDVVQNLCDYEIGIVSRDECYQAYVSLAEKYSTLCAYRIMESDHRDVQHNWINAEQDVGALERALLEAYSVYYSANEKFKTALNDSINSTKSAFDISFIADADDCVDKNDKGIKICEKNAERLAYEASEHNAVALKAASNLNYLLTVYKTVTRRF